MGDVNCLVLRPHNSACSMPMALIKQENNLSFSNTYPIQADAIRRNTQDVIDWDLLSTEQALALLEQKAKPPSMNSLVSVLQKCRKKRSLVYAKRAHAYLCKNKMESQRMLGNYLVPMFVDCGGLPDAQQVFNKLVHRNEFSWSSLIHGYSGCGDFQRALSLYKNMQELGVLPSLYTFLSLLKACGRLKSIEKGREIHHWIVTLGFENENLIGNTIVDMYAKFGSLTEAQEVFLSLSIRDVVSWTALISGYADNGLGKEVWDCLEEMHLEGVSPDAGTHVCSLKAFSNTGAIDYGRDVHSQVIMGGYENDPLIGNILVDMYAKCGSLMEAWETFNKMPTQGVISWTALIAGHARLGECEMVFDLFEEMRSQGVCPNDATFLIILSVCSHAGMVEKGLLYCELMEHEYGITPSIKHHNCMLDLLCRSGQLNAAMLMLEKMPLTPNLVTWKTLLSACRKWGNVEIAKQAFELAMRKERNQASVFALMSNIFADANMWKDLKKLEKRQVDMQAGKELERSWIEINGLMHAFVEGETGPYDQELHCRLDQLQAEIKEVRAGDVETASVDKEKAFASGEKRAITFGLLRVLRGAPIRLVKNLWLCKHSHAFVALISKMEQRVIFCRDAKHLHVFKDGNCSCGGS